MPAALAAVKVVELPEQIVIVPVTPLMVGIGFTVNTTGVLETETQPALITCT